MTTTEIITEQLFDPFRLGLLFFLILTARNTAHHTKTLLPLLAGIVFVAVLLPMTFTPGAGNFWHLVLAGLVTNTVLVAIVYGCFMVFSRFQKGNAES